MSSNKKTKKQEIFDKIICCEPDLQPFIDEIRNIKPLSQEEIDSQFWQERRSKADIDIHLIAQSFLPKAVCIAFEFSERNGMNLQEAINITYLTLLEYILFSVKNRKWELSANLVWAKIRRELSAWAELEAVEVPGGIYFDDSEEELDDELKFEILEKARIPEDQLLKIAEDTMLKEQLDEILSTLTEREEKCVRLYFGFDDGIVRNLDQVGKYFDRSGSWVGLVLQKAYRKIRHPSRSRKIKDYADLRPSERIAYDTRVHNLHTNRIQSDEKITELTTADLIDKQESLTTEPIDIETKHTWFPGLSDEVNESAQRVLDGLNEISEKLRELSDMLSAYNKSRENRYDDLEIDDYLELDEEIDDLSDWEFDDLDE